MLPIALALSLSVLPQSPSTATQDVVRLKIGTELAGRIVQETADYLEIELGDGTVVGFEKSRTAAIVRGASVPVAAAPKPTASRYPERDQWNVLHDAEGRAVGWMHATLVHTDDGSTRIGEEWRFAAGTKTVETTLLEVLDADGTPERAFCHERIRGADDRTDGERIVNAVVEDGRLAVSRRNDRGNDRQVYEFAPGTRFPLELREEMRAIPVGEQREVNHVVFDPLLDEFGGRSFDVGGTRRVDLGGGNVVNVRVLTAANGRSENTEWLDAAAKPLRSEIAGPALVAVPVRDESAARNAVATTAAVFPPSFHSAGGGHFGMWLPSPIWAFDTLDGDDEIRVSSTLDDASLTLVRMDQLAESLGLPSAADAVLRWLRIAYRRIDVVDRSTVTVRGVPAERIRARAVRRDQGDVEMLVHVLAIDGQWFASCGSASHTVFTRVEPEFEWMVERFELRKDDVAPEPQGPLARPARKRAR